MADLASACKSIKWKIWLLWANILILNVLIYFSLYFQDKSQSLILLNVNNSSTKILSGVTSTTTMTSLGNATINDTSKTTAKPSTLASKVTLGPPIKPLQSEPNYHNNFQKVFVQNGNKTLIKMLLYSAWYDPRLPNEVRIIGFNLAEAPTAEKLTCVFMGKLLDSRNSTYNNSGSNRTNSTNVRLEPVKVPLKSRMMQFWQLSPWHPQTWQMTCEMMVGISFVNWSVSIHYSAYDDCCTANITNLLPVQRIDIQSNRKNFAVCVQPLFSISDVNNLVEMIEVNRLLGAEYFYFYNYSVSQNVSKALLYYAHWTDYVEVIQWHSSEKESLGIGSGQMAALADCNRRVMQRFKYMISSDLDEFLVVRTQRTWHDFVMNYAIDRRAGQYLFANVYYFKENSVPKNSTSELDIVTYGLRTLSYVQRYVHGLSYSIRTKAIVWADCVENHLIHAASKFLPIASCADLTTVHLNTNVGMLQHYRHTTAQLPEESDKVIDTYFRTMFKDELLSAVRHKHSELRKLIP